MKTIILNNEVVKIGAYKVQGYKLYRGFIDHYYKCTKLYRQIININRLNKTDALYDAEKHFESYLIANNL